MRVISVAALQLLIGADVFPALAPAVKQQASDVLVGAHDRLASLIGGNGFDFRR
jgi:hypothetical protein